MSKNCSDRGPGGWQGARLFGMKNKKPPLGILEGVLKIRRYLLSHWYALSSAQKA